MPSMKHVVPCQITVTKNLSFHGGSDHSWKEGIRTTWQWELHIKWEGTVAFWHALHIISPGNTSSFEDVSVKESHQRSTYRSTGLFRHYWNVFQSHLHLNPRCWVFEELTVSQLVKTLCLLQNLRVHYRVHNSLSLVLSWARWIWCTPLIMYLFKIHSTLMLVSMLKSLPSRFSEWNVTCVLILLVYVMCPAHLILLALTILILFDDHIGIHIHLLLNTEWPKSQLIG